MEEQMNDQQALEKIKEEYPEFTRDAEQMILDGESVVKLLSILDSFY